VILAYCFLASIVPMWLLLQPRGYLGGLFLYVTLIAGVAGLLLGAETVRYPAFRGWQSPQGLPLFPMLFVMVACGACSGFHGIVSSGTTSKQISREPDCRLVGYGGMLLESLVAVIALATVMLLAPGEPLSLQSPDRIYADGLSHFVGQFGINREMARSFALLAFATFIFDTLDVATRLGRYVFQELTGWKGTTGRIAATLCTLALPAFCVSLRVEDAAGQVVPAWKVFWMVFGTSNQLLAALSLLTLTVWLRQTTRAHPTPESAPPAEGHPRLTRQRGGGIPPQRSWWTCAVAAVFVLTMTLWSLALMGRPWVVGLMRGAWTMNWIALVALILMVLAVLIVAEALKAFRGKLRAAGAATPNTS
jgi:carbon starvation protein